MDAIDKREIVALLRARIAEELAGATAAAKDAARAATHEEARPENDKDTRGLEASYLARGQAARVRELELADNALQFMPLRALGDGAIVELGAVVEVTDEAGACLVYFIAPAGGGTRVVVRGVEVNVVSPQSPMGKLLLGHGVGDTFERPGKRVEHEITGVG